ncbi:MAG: hypothetical protein P1V51_10530 [Deltaproteobacteria bacterium]|nr:hypothetical protein [Deltaproteobacteria bacterium]
MATGCAGAAAYGPSADDRLEAATENVGTVQASGGLEDAVMAIEATGCEKLGPVLTGLKSDTSDEEAQLAGLTGLLDQAKAANETIQQTVADRPGSAYFSGKTTDGAEHDIPAYVQACEATRIDTEQTLDRRIRDILLAPVVTDFVGKKRKQEVLKARVDLDLLAKAVNVLSPADLSTLLGEIEAAKAKLVEAEKPRGKKRRR